jgi:hypothetical protein
MDACACKACQLTERIISARFGGVVRKGFTEEEISRLRLTALSGMLPR